MGIGYQEDEFIEIDKRQFDFTGMKVGDDIFVAFKDNWFESHYTGFFKNEKRADDFVESASKLFEGSKWKIMSNSYKITKIKSNKLTFMIEGG